MFSLEDIELAHSKVKTGADFPKYIQEIKGMGVTAFETWVTDSHTNYLGNEGYQLTSKPQYDTLTIANKSDKDKFSQYLKIHQKGQTDYSTFCKQCAETGIEKWLVDLDKMTCTYYDKSENELLIEKVPSV